MQRVVPDEERFAQLFVPVQRPWGTQHFAKLLFVLLDPGLGQEVLAVNRVFEAEEIKDRAKEVIPVLRVQLVEQRRVLPESFLSGHFLQLQVLDGKERALLEVG
jgi:hypothetical protein